MATTEPIKTMKLAEKLAATRAKIGSLKPDKTNKDQNYQYISADKILERAGDVLAEMGVCIVPSVVETTLTAIERPNKAPRIDAIVKFSMSIYDGTDEFTAAWVGCGSDYATPDKAIYKAITSGHKYFLMKLLNIGVGNEDSEHESGEDETRQASQKSTSKPADTLTEQPAPEAVPFMTYDDARKLVSSTGELYGNRPTEDLVHVFNNKKTPAKNREAARIIIEYRAANPETTSA